MQFIKIILSSLSILLLFYAFSCTPANEILNMSSSSRLSFSRDTVLFDTVFTAQPTFTRRLVLYNRNKNALNISEMSIAGGQNSPYSITVFGETKTTFQNIRILGNDSLLVLLNASINPKQQDLPFIVRDSILFNVNGNKQEIKIIGWGQDAHYLRNQRIRQNAVWSGKKPYIISGILQVDSLVNLTIEQGVTVYMDINAAIFVKGSLTINGKVLDKVNFRGVRLDRRYENIAGQWDAIYFDVGSKNNKINYAHIRNGNVGLRIGAPPDKDTIPELVVENTIIENMRFRGLISFSSDVYMTNTLINNCTQNTVACLAGGDYTFLHCTFANTETRFFTDEPAVYIANFYRLPDESVLKSPLSLTMINCIVWGDRANDFQVNSASDVPAQWLVKNSLLKTTDNQFNNNNNILNQRPRFKSAFRSNFQLDSLSPAIDKGLPIGIITDLEGIVRDSKPDLGAYERKK
ncbi:choice-of-anchor Q domain-containing protein [Thermoflexibacter ruber]|uniref:Right handed beta helix region n=1 Tax=Thermoflexibacter ruber TaxID=1003 RepID=A0A1I2FNQ8_9BACT|nr:choice-of-anchor Q domain-containing protein [Thermoflexibacter ruber]SFF06230.1 hypothetical protein SAMN04488541_101469 [Thermoflexibacter ruber]